MNMNKQPSEAEPNQTSPYNVERIYEFIVDVLFRFTLNTKCQEHMADGRMEMDFPIYRLSHADYVLRGSLCTTEGREWGNGAAKLYK